MHNLVNNKVKHKSNKVKASWDAAIWELNRQLGETRKRASRLQKAIKTWTRLRDEGMPWPGQR